MKKVSISIYFTIIFTLLMAAPLVIAVLDKSFDTSVFYNVNEGESNKSCELTQIKIIPFYVTSNSITNILKLQKTKYHFYCLDTYMAHALETALQPPEFTMRYS